MITEDGLSVASFESSSAGDDYVVVSADPNQMRSNGDCNDLSHAVMTTNLNDIDNVAIPLKMLNQSNLENVTNVMPSSQSVDALTVEILAEDEPGVYCYLLYKTFLFYFRWFVCNYNHSR